MESRIALSALAASALVALSTSCSKPAENSDKIRIGVSIPSADHGWTGGVVWWAQKVINEWKAEDPNLVFYLVTADSATKQVSDIVA